MDNPVLAVTCMVTPSLIRYMPSLRRSLTGRVVGR
jgi:hypothetical protein